MGDVPYTPRTQRSRFNVEHRGERRTSFAVHRLRRAPGRWRRPLLRGLRLVGDVVKRSSGIAPLSRTLWTWPAWVRRVDRFGVKHQVDLIILCVLLAVAVLALERRAHPRRSPDVAVQP